MDPNRTKQLFFTKTHHSKPQPSTLNVFFLQFYTPGLVPGTSPIRRAPKCHADCRQNYILISHIDPVRAHKDISPKTMY